MADSTQTAGKGLLTDTTIHDLVLKLGRDRARHVRLVDGRSGEERSFERIEERSRRVASALLARQLSPGCVVGVAIPNSPLIAEIALGVFSAGMTLALFNPDLSPEDVTQPLRDADVQLLITHADCPGAKADAGIVDVVVIDDSKSGASYEDFISVSPASDLPAVSPDSVATIFQSSGTTSPSKPVELTHASIVGFIDAIDKRGDLTSSNIMLAATPVFHVMGLPGAILTSLYSGATAVIVQKPTAEEMLDLIDEYEISLLLGSPPMMEVVAKAAATGRVKSLKRIYSGGSALSAVTERQLRKLFPNATVAQAYGLTEMPVVSMPGIGTVQPLGSVGDAIPGTALKIVDPDGGEECSVDEIGEILARGPQSMKGYRGRPEETARVIDADGWLHTGDLGRVDSDGYLFITGRLSEMITINGRRLAPREFEEALTDHDLVHEVIVTGSGNDTANQVPIVFVVGDKRLQPETVKALLRDRLPDIPECEVVFVEEIPRTPAGKVQRRILLENLSLPGRVAG